MKTTTFFIAMVTIISYATGRKPTAFKRKISDSLMIIPLGVSRFKMFCFFSQIINAFLQRAYG